ncbi:hypothetical protein F5Y08DRAFT_299145 [Xylaria arbuscula]|nr:hypothetical protein F5Y08DRAFT_299145 [Xylaria arbuscula]
MTEVQRALTLVSFPIPSAAAPGHELGIVKHGAETDCWSTILCCTDYHITQYLSYADLVKLIHGDSSRPHRGGPYPFLTFPA